MGKFHTETQSPDDVKKLFTEGTKLRGQIESGNKNPQQARKRLLVIMNSIFQQVSDPSQKVEISTWAAVLDTAKTAQEHVGRILQKTRSEVSHRMGVPKKAAPRNKRPKLTLDKRKQRASPESWEVIEPKEVIDSMSVMMAQRDINDKAIKGFIGSMQSAVETMARTEQPTLFIQCLDELAKISVSMNLANDIPHMLLTIILTRRNVPEQTQESIRYVWNNALTKYRNLK